MSDKRTANLLVCNCQRTMDIDGGKLASGLGRDEPIAVHSELCRAGLQNFEKAVRAGGAIHVACTQEAPLFREVAAEQATADTTSLRFTNIREDAGWCEAKAGAVAKMAALLAGAGLEPQPADQMTLKSGGVCLVYGKGETALQAAEKLSGRLSVSILLSETDDALPPSVVDAPIARGRIRNASGHLGAFAIEVDGYAAALPSSRSALEFAMPRDGATSHCDLILDLSGRAPLFTAHERRDGYVVVDSTDRATLAEALFRIADLVGEFEKPVYINYDASICAHARSGKIGCRNCLDHCPVGAITPDGDHVAIDTAICGGCGNCASVCPTGAASYAYPKREDILARTTAMLDAYARAGGRDPVLLVHDGKHGRAMIDAIARYGKGLAPNVIPLAVNSVLQFGHDTLATLLALGASRIAVIVPPEHPAELAALEAQAALCETMMAAWGYAAPRVLLLAEADPFVIEARLGEAPALPALTAHRFTTAGDKRQTARTTFTKLNETAPSRQPVMPLPAGAPYGRIQIDTAGCTLCLSCVGACPTGALGDNAERPEVSFTEAACVQCGLCRVTCPEKVITLEPRLDLTNAALSPTVLYGEEPFACISCGKPFGSRRMIERVSERLKSHSMFADSSQLQIIQMCDTCRITTLAERADDPFRGPPRPRVVTTDDYLADGTSAAGNGKPKKPEDFLS